MSEREKRLGSYTSLVLHGRRVASDAGEGLTPEEEKARWKYAFDVSHREIAAEHVRKGTGSPTLLAHYRDELSKQPPVAPARPVPWMQCDELKRRREDAELDQECAAIEAELKALRAGTVRKDGFGIFYDFTGAPELEQRWNRAHDEAEARIVARQPPILLKDGDMVRVGGHLLQVSHLNPLRRTASLNALDANGHVVAGESGCSIEGLVPVDPKAEAAKPFPEPPDSVRDGYGRARFSMNQLAAALRRDGRGGD